MHLMLLRLFQDQVADQCRVAMAGVEQMNVELNRLGDDAFDHDRFWAGCQVMLTGAANVSKALWGIRGGKPAEQAEREAVREPVRRSLQVPDDSPLRDVAMRNNFEHLDERLLDWWEQSENHLHADRLIGPLGRMIGGLSEMEMFRQYDPQSKLLAFWGKTYDVQALVTAVSDLLPRATAEAAKPFWET